MLSKSKVRFINSLKRKKYRKEHGLFIAEGPRMAEELINSSFQIHSVYGTRKWAERNPATGCTEVTEKELKHISALATPNQVLCLARIPAWKPGKKEMTGKLSIALDGVSDPGNMGTIVRIADWFGIENIICSQDCVDAYNPKTVQATMGSIVRVKIHCVKLDEFLSGIHGVRVYGCALDGKNIGDATLDEKGIILLGSEAAGISSELDRFISHRIAIPGAGKAESLNVAAAAAIACYEFCRRAWQKTR